MVVVRRKVPEPEEPQTVPVRQMALALAELEAFAAAVVLEPVLRMEHQKVLEQLAAEHRKAAVAQLDHIGQVPAAALRKALARLVVVALRTAVVQMARPALVVAFAVASVAECLAAFELVQAFAVRRFHQPAWPFLVLQDFWRTSRPLQYRLN